MDGSIWPSELSLAGVNVRSNFNQGVLGHYFIGDQPGSRIWEVEHKEETDAGSCQQAEKEKVYGNGECVQWTDEFIDMSRRTLQDVKWGIVVG